jgi:hypothetical protein
MEPPPGLRGRLTLRAAEPNVVSVSDNKNSATFADEVELLTPQGCTAPFGDMKVDRDGLGQTPCTTDTYQDVDHCAPGCCVEMSYTYATGPDISLCIQGLHRPAPEM